jgi:hypothetical protein
MHHHVSNQVDQAACVSPDRNLASFDAAYLSGTCVAAWCSSSVAQAYLSMQVLVVQPRAFRPKALSKPMQNPHFVAFNITT